MLTGHLLCVRPYISELSVLITLQEAGSVKCRGPQSLVVPGLGVQLPTMAFEKRHLLELCSAHFCDGGGQSCGVGGCAYYPEQVMYLLMSQEISYLIFYLQWHLASVTFTRNN